MRFNTPRDDEIVDIMLREARKWCADNRRKWSNPDYCPEIQGLQREIHFNRWQYTDWRCWQLTTYLKGVLKDAPERTDYASIPNRE